MAPPKAKGTGSPSKQQKTEARNHNLSQCHSCSALVNIAMTTILPKGSNRNGNDDKQNNNTLFKKNKGDGNPKDDGESRFAAVNDAAIKCPRKATIRNTDDDDEGSPNKEDETNKGINELVTTDDDAKGTRKDDGANNANSPNTLDRFTDLVSNIQHFPFWNLQLLYF